MKRGKAPGLDELTIEHLVNSHPVLVVILSKLFNLFVSAVHVPHGFRLSYTVPLLKEDQNYKGNSVDNYRAISISPVMSNNFWTLCTSQIDAANFLWQVPISLVSRKGLAVAMLYTPVRKVVEHYGASGSAVNVCLLDLSKAFDKIDHSALYLKLMDRAIPVQILKVLQTGSPRVCLALSGVQWCLIL